MLAVVALSFVACNKETTATTDTGKTTSATEGSKTA